MPGSFLNLNVYYSRNCSALNADTTFVKSNCKNQTALIPLVCFFLFGIIENFLYIFYIKVRIVITFNTAAGSTNISYISTITIKT